MHITQKQGFFVKDLSPIKNILSIMEQKHFYKKMRDCWTTGILYHARMGQHFSPKKIYQLIASVSRRGMFRVVNMAMSQHFWDVLPQIEIQNDQILNLGYSHQWEFFQFKHLIFSVFQCSTVTCHFMRLETSKKIPTLLTTLPLLTDTTVLCLLSSQKTSRKSVLRQSIRLQTLTMSLIPDVTPRCQYYRPMGGLAFQL